MSAQLILMAKAPTIGTVKTRLQPMLTAAQAARFHQACVEDTLMNCLALTLRVSLACAPDTQHDFFQCLRQQTGVSLVPQGEGDLGQRMGRLQQAAFDSGCGQVLFVGADSPHMSPQRVTEALQVLQSSPVALGPAEDGGYYLLGSNQRTPQLFAHIPWGSGDVLSATRQSLQKSGLGYVELAQGWDVDRPEDLKRLHALLVDNPSAAPRTTGVLRDISL